MNDPLRKLSWDDLRIVKAIGQSGSLALAGTALGLNTSTVSRRLTQVEDALGVTLFDRRRAGYLPTAAGLELIALAERVELDVVSVARRVSGHAESRAGELRVTTSDALMLDFLTPIIADFQTSNPSVRVDVIVGNCLLNLARGESDIAFRAVTGAPPENLFGRKVATIAWAVYGRRSDFLDGRPLPGEIYQHQWVSYGKNLSGLKAYGFVETRVPGERIVFRCDSVAGMATAIAAGIGVGFLPCMHGDTATDLIRVGSIEPDISDELWILTHPDIRKSGRISAFMTHCMEAIAKRRAFIEGRAAPGEQQR
ncbi:LysR family transcriptional regulator [Bradyrhizobium sp. LHD-71]|uniref:LysR family transcriptional regulator n=1 Tax=Bradyrhizobium sp. LHD-71 TaxID=3072141 RepID=UPI0028103508|nr:LysR family transcriptional regulator [Bradyrhizobium sp. LHD-71]MDQ8728295.1 LysR family transcriptional regulator [Bradyrhizobium sp. LHD-71]